MTLHCGHTTDNFGSLGREWKSVLQMMGSYFKSEGSGIRALLSDTLVGNLGRRDWGQGVQLVGPLEKSRSWIQQPVYL